MVPSKDDATRESDSMGWDGIGFFFLCVCVFFLGKMLGTTVFFLLGRLARLDCRWHLALFCAVISCWQGHFSGRLLERSMAFDAEYLNA